MLNREDINGVGTVTQWTDGRTTYHFFRDFGPDKGVDRAASFASTLIDAGEIRRVDYIHKDEKTIHFFDWTTKPDSFCAADEMRKYCKERGHEIYSQLFSFIAIINGDKYRLDYTGAIDGISAIIATPAN